MTNSAIGSLVVTARDLGLLALRVSDGADMEHSAHVVVDFSLLSRNIVRSGPRRHLLEGTLLPTFFMLLGKSTASG